MDGLEGVTPEDEAAVEALVNQVLGELMILEFPDMIVEIPVRLKGKSHPKIPKEWGGEDEPAPSKPKK